MTEKKALIFLNFWIVIILSALPQPSSSMNLSHRLLPSRTRAIGLGIRPVLGVAQRFGRFGEISLCTRWVHNDEASEVPTVVDGTSSGNYEKTYRLDGFGRRSKVEITTNTGHHLSTDVPRKMGGTDTAAQPVETLLAAWMGCTQATAVFVGRQMSPRIIIESLEFEGIEAVRDERGALALPIEENPSVPSRLRRISGRIRVSTRAKTKMSNEELELLKEQTEIRCPIANMILASGCAIDVEWADVTFAQ